MDGSMVHSFFLSPASFQSLSHCSDSLLPHPGPKSPGLIILEHELKAETIAAFKHIFPIVKQTGWTFASVSQLFNDKTPYQNAGTSTNSTVKSQAIIGAVAAAPAASGSGSKTGGTATATGTIAGTAGKDSELSSAIRVRGGGWLLSCIIACFVLYMYLL
jgi:chitin deacetylase